MFISKDVGNDLNPIDNFFILSFLSLSTTLVDRKIIDLEIKFVITSVSLSGLTGGLRKRLWWALLVSCVGKIDRSYVMFGFLIAFQYDFFTFKLHRESNETSVK